MKAQVYTEFLGTLADGHAGLFILIDPDKANPESEDTIKLVSEDSPADFVLVGTSIQFMDSFDDWLYSLRAHARRPIVLFPGSVKQLSRYADAVLFISLISGRNAEHVIGQQVHGAPLVRSLGLEAIGTGYILVESGRASATEIATGTDPLPAGRSDIAVAHALAAEYLGMKLVYLDAGSGAPTHVPCQMVEEVSDAISIPLVVGGGITTADQASSLVRSGADFIVVGNAFEKTAGIELARDISTAVHETASRKHLSRVEVS